MDEKTYALGLAHAELPPRKLTDVLKHFGSARTLWNAPVEELRGVLSPAERRRFAAFREAFSFPAAKKKLESKGIGFLWIGELAYPKRLKEIHDPPVGLFYKGKVDGLSAPCLAIVGSRNASASAKSQARTWAGKLARCGFTIVSGLARGIDTAAHRGALEENGKTVAVLGSGVDVIYPPENKNLARSIELGGSVMSEFPPGARPYPWNFPQRNRILSGLSIGVFVIEARDKSGALITARFAGEQGREVFALPGLRGSENAVGSNALIGDGAKVVQEIRDVLEEFPYLTFEPIVSEVRPDSLPEVKILESLQGENEGKVMELLMKETKIPMNALSASLLVLETKGLVRRLPGNIYVKA